ncbi:WAT1-related protein [Senna tora]|uniref:WAT1-related protein n=1 Tax=Senna tora TaxID=362788 RepID=A0A834TGE7_9FABA|nr:WAT1-related protein [Senna tora]
MCSVASPYSSVVLSLCPISILVSGLLRLQLISRDGSFIGSPSKATKGLPVTMGVGAGAQVSMLNFFTVEFLLVALSELASNVSLLELESVVVVPLPSCWLTLLFSRWLTIFFSAPVFITKGMMQLSSLDSELFRLFKNPMELGNNEGSKITCLEISYSVLNVLNKLAYTDFGLNMSVALTYRIIFATAFMAPFALFIERKQGEMAQTSKL